MTEGNIYLLKEDIGEIPSGVWAVVEIGMMITLSRVGADEDRNICTMHRLANVTREEVESFDDMRLTVKFDDDLAADIN